MNSVLKCKFGGEIRSYSSSHRYHEPIVKDGFARSSLTVAIISLQQSRSSHFKRLIIDDRQHLHISVERPAVFLTGAFVIRDYIMGIIFASFQPKKLSLGTYFSYVTSFLK
jgi:hypothetical protein